MSRLVLRFGTTAVALFCFVSPGRAVTCEEVRGLSAAERSYWAGRLQVSPAYLAALLERAFCELGATRERAIAREREPVKLLDRTSSLADESR